jgi:hypothetical protein
MARQTQGCLGTAATVQGAPRPGPDGPELGPSLDLCHLTPGRCRAEPLTLPTPSSLATAGLTWVRAGHVAAGSFESGRGPGSWGRAGD